MSLKSFPLNPVLNPTKAAIVQAATKVFAQDGIKGATTKEIAKQAGVHETTLFRHFENKQALLIEVIRQLSLEMTAALDQTPHEWTENLYHDLLFYARVYQQTLIQHNDFIRMLVGEGNRHAEFLQEITQSSNLPFREHLLAYLEQARLLGQIRPTLQPEILANILTGMIFAGALRSCLPPGDGLTDNYLQQCLDVFIQGIENNT